MNHKPSPAELDAAWTLMAECARIEAKHARDIAKSRWLIYRAHIEAGFTEAQALELCAKTGFNG